MSSILIIDDDETIAELIKDVLTTKCKYSADVSHTGEDALKKLRGQRVYDLMILDLLMPRVSGIEVCATMLEDENIRNTPVLFISALPLDSPIFQEARERFKKWGIVKGLLEKPFDIDNLRVKVESIIKK